MRSFLEMCECVSEPPPESSFPLGREKREGGRRLPTPLLKQRHPFDRSFFDLCRHYSLKLPTIYILLNPHAPAEITVHYIEVHILFQSCFSVVFNVTSVLVLEAAAVSDQLTEFSLHLILFFRSLL